MAVQQHVLVVVRRQQSAYSLAPCEQVIGGAACATVGKEGRTALGLVKDDAVDGIQADVDHVVKLQRVRGRLLKRMHQQRVVLQPATLPP